MHIYSFASELHEEGGFAHLPDAIQIGMQKNTFNKKKSVLMPVICHLNITLCSFSSYESPMRFGDVTARGLVIDSEERRIGQLLA